MVTEEMSRLCSYMGLAMSAPYECPTPSICCVNCLHLRLYKMVAIKSEKLEGRPWESGVDDTRLEVLKLSYQTAVKYTYTGKCPYFNADNTEDKGCIDGESSYEVTTEHLKVSEDTLNAAFTDEVVELIHKHLESSFGFVNDKTNLRIARINDSKALAFSYNSEPCRRNAAASGCEAAVVKEEMENFKNFVKKPISSLEFDKPKKTLTGSLSFSGDHLVEISCMAEDGDASLDDDASDTLNFYWSFGGAKIAEDKKGPSGYFGEDVHINFGLEANVFSDDPIEPNKQVVYFVKCPSVENKESAILKWIGLWLKDAYFHAIDYCNKYGPVFSDDFFYPSGVNVKTVATREGAAVLAVAFRPFKGRKEESSKYTAHYGKIIKEANGRFKSYHKEHYFGNEGLEAKFNTFISKIEAKAEKACENVVDEGFFKLDHLETANDLGISRDFNLIALYDCSKLAQDDTLDKFFEAMAKVKKDYLDLIKHISLGSVKLACINGDRLL